MERLYNKALKISGTDGLYQYLITIILLLFGITTNICYAGLFLMETSPLVEYSYFDEDKNATIIDIVTINYDICKSKNYTILHDQSKNTWVYDYNIYCDKFKVSLIGFFYCFGSIIGALSIQFYIKDIGPKLAIIYNAYLFVFFSFILCFNSVNLYILYISLFCFGFATVTILLIKVTYLSEISSTTIRPFLNNIVMSASSLTLILMYFLFENNIHYKSIYAFNALIMIALTITFKLIASDSPRYLLQNGLKKDFLLSILSIHSFNKKDLNGSNEELSQFIMEFKEVPNLRDILYNLFGHKKFNQLKISPEQYFYNDDQERNPIISAAESSSSSSSSNSLIHHISTSSDTLSSSNANALNQNHIDRISKEEIFNNKRKLKYNFIFTFGLINFLSFSFNIGMKEYSYYFHSKFYLMCLLTMFSSFPLGYFMNTLGRKGTKIYLFIIFMIVIYIKQLEIFDIYVITMLFLINKLMIHGIYMVNLTHLNESFSANLRIIVASWANMLGKFLSALAPFVIEYLYRQLENIMLIIAAVCLLLILNQVETHKKELTD